jgi:hypothetical protein
LHRFALTIAVLAALLGGCRRAQIRGDDPVGPVQVLSITPTYRSDGSADFSVLMAVANPEAQPGSATKASWRLWLQRRLFAEGEQVIAQKLTARSTTRFELMIPIALRRAAAPADLVPVELSIRGDLTAEIGGSEKTLPFAQTTRVNAPSNRAAGAEED